MKKLVVGLLILAALAFFFTQVKSVPKLPDLGTSYGKTVEQSKENLQQGVNDIMKEALNGTGK